MKDAKVAWVIPSFIEGSGGYRTVFQHVNEMAKKYECHVYVYDSGDYRDANMLEKAAQKYYGKCECKFFLGYEISKDVKYKFIIATSWMTAETVYLYSGNAKKLYFVQDYEPLFYAAGDMYLNAAGTYDFGFYHITIGKWLAAELQRKHNANVSYFDFGVEKKIYYSKEALREKAVCFIYQPEKPRRAPLLGLETLRIVKKIRPDVTIYLYGAKETANVEFECVQLGLISPENCADLYRKCKVGLCISASNPSRIPFEMMACGLPVVDIYAENNLYDYSSDVITLASSRAETLAQAIIKILDDKKYWNKISQSGIEFVKNRTIESGMKQFDAIIQKLEEEKNPSENLRIEKTYNKKPEETRQEIKDFVRKQKESKTPNILEKIKHLYWVRKLPGIKVLAAKIKNNKY